MRRSPLFPVVICMLALGWMFVLWWTLLTYDQPAVQAATAAQIVQPDDPDDDTVLKVTVGTVPNLCAPTSAITVSMGATVYYCYLLDNKSNYTLTTHSLVDPAIGLSNQLTLLITPRNGMTPAQEIPGFAPAFQPIHSTVTWIATSTNGLTFTAQSHFQINMPTLAVTATLSTDPQECGASAEIAVAVGTQVYYCYQVRNTSSLTLTIPQVDGAASNLSQQPPFVLGPGAGINLTATAIITQTTDQTISMTGVTQNDLTTLAQAQTTARVPALQLTTTVGLEINTCAATNTITIPVGTQVYYCYKLTNLGGVPFTRHRILGSTIPRGNRDVSFPVEGIADVTFRLPMTITETRGHTVTWIAWTADELTATASALVTTTALTTLTVEVFYDVNGARNRELHEPPLLNARLTLSYPNGVPLTATTNVSGLIVLTNIPARVYTATVNSQPRFPNVAYVASTGAATRRLDLRNRLATHALFGFTLPPPLDDDNDGIPNQFEGAGDEDGDGIPNYLDKSPKVFVPLLRRAK